MKRILLFFSLLLTSFVGYSQNKGINYQAVIIDPNPIEIPGRDVSAQPYVNKEVWLKFTISQDGVTQYEEIQKTQTDSYGLVNLTIGTGINTGKGGTFASLSWEGNTKNIVTSVSFDRGSRYVEVGNQRLNHVPYSLYSETANKLSGVLPISSGGTGAITSTAARANLGLDKVDNTSDMSKPVSTATLAILDTKESLSNKSTNIIADSASSVKYPSVKAIKDYIDSRNSASANSARLADKAKALETPRTINGVPFDGTTNITIPVGVTPPDASTTAKGLVQLAGDLTGNAGAPTIAAGAVSTEKVADGAVTDAKIVTVSGSKVTGNIAGNAATATLATTATSANTATKLTTARTINGVPFDGSADITVAANAATLSGTVAIAKGGTGATTAADARTNLGLVIGTDVLAQRTFGTAANSAATDFVAATEKGANNGVATLGVNGKIPSIQIPAISFQSVSVVNSDATMTAISGAQVGSIAIRSDQNINYVLSALPATTLSNWIQLAASTDVSTINGIVGPSVNLTTNEIPEGNANKYFTDARVRNALSAVAPLNFNASTGVLSMTAASASANGYLSSADWTTFNNKQTALTAGVDYATPSGNITGNAANVTGIVSIANGGTGTSTAAGALVALGAEPSDNKSDNILLDGNSTTKFPTFRAIKSYVDQQSQNAGVADNSITSAKIFGTLAVLKGGTGASNPADARTNLGLVIGTDVMAANFTTTLTGDVAGSGNGSFATTVNAVGGVSSATISTLPGLITNNTTGIAANTASITSNTNAIAANTASISTNTANILLRAPIASPTFTGTPSAPTPAISDNSTTLATTEYVKSNLATVSAGTLTGTTLASTITGSSLTSVGTITSGVWSATEIAIAKGGTGATTAAGARTSLGLTIGTDVMAANFTTTLTGDVTGSGNGSFVTTLTDSGVSSGTYGSSTAIPVLTVDSKGRLTSASTVGIIAGVNTLNYTSTTSYAAGGTISGTTLTLAAANATNPGLISTGAQTIAGAKTFSNDVTAPNFVGNLTGNATTATTAGNITATSNNTLTSLSNLNTVGTITSGTWSGTTIDIAKGGTGATTAAAARTNLGLTIGTDVMAANATTTLTGDVTGSGNGSFATTVNSVGGVSSNTISTLPTTVASNTASITANAQAIALRATIASPSFTGTPTAPTPATGDNSTKIATTEYVQASITAASAGVSSVGPISATANANGATISGSSQLILTPASASFGGVVTTAAQTFAGAKTFSETTTFNSDITVNGIKIGLGNTGVTSNTGVGFGTLSSVTSGTDLTALGYNALNRNSSGASNTATGRNALLANTTGANNTAIGRSALESNTTGGSNFAGGMDALKWNTSGQFNTAIGGASLTSLTSGERNTAVGYWALRHLAGFTNNTSNNTAIGADAGRFFGSGTSTLTRSTNGVFLGSNTRPSADLTINEVVIGADAVGNGSNTVTVGNLSNTATFFTGNINLTGNVVGGTWSGTTIGSNYGGAGSINGILKANGSGVVSAAISGTDFQAPLTAGSGISIASGTISATGLTSANLSSTAGITNSQLANSSTILGSTTMTLGGTVTSVTGLTSLAATNLTGTLSGTATSLATGRTIALTGDVTYTSPAFDGSGDVTAAATLAASGVASGTYGSSTAIPVLTVDTKGRVTSASTVGIIAGVNSLNYTSTTSYASGGTISGTSLTLAAADGTNPGLISTGAQTIAGAKTFNSDLVVNGMTVGKGGGNVVNNTALGFNALTANVASGTPGINNTAVGYNSLSANTTGGNNVAIGNSAGSVNVGGSNNVFIGNNANAAAGLVNNANAIAIGSNAIVDAPNKIQLGDQNITAVNTSGTITAAGFTGPLSGNATTATTAGNITATSNTTLTSLANLATVGTITSGVWSGTAIANNKLANSSTTLGSTTMILGGTVTSVTGLVSVSSTGFTGALTGNASTATTLATARNINGVAFDGSANITIAADANTLTGTTLASNIVNSSLTGVGTITSGTWSGTAIAIANGGTGATTKAAGFNALSPMTTSGDIIYGGASGTGTRLGVGTTGQVLSISGGLPAWTTLSSGVTTMAAIGSSANANGATISGTTLNLEPASASFGGVVTTGTQTFAGSKTFNSDLTVNGMRVGKGVATATSNSSSTALGTSTLGLNSTGTANTAIGFQNLQANTSGSNNTAVGSDVLSSNSTGSDNIGIGSSTLNSASNGSNNVAIGNNVLKAGSSFLNVGIGNYALTANTGTANIGIGPYAGTNLADNTANSGSNIFIGYEAGSKVGSSTSTNLSGRNSILIGRDTRPLNNGDTNEIVIAGWTGSGNGATGLGSNTTSIGIDATTTTRIFGDLTLPRTTASTSTTTGALIVSGGAGIAGAVNVGGNVRASSFNGMNAGSVSTVSNTSNTILGRDAYNTTATGTTNTAVGEEALKANTSGSSNVAMGYRALFRNTSGAYNVALGDRALQNNTTNMGNIGIGYAALSALNGSNSTIAIGQDAGGRLTAGEFNIFIGPSSGQYVGSSTTANTISKWSTLIGYDTRGSADGNTNEVVLAGYNGTAGAVGLGSNTTLIGNSATTLTQLMGAVNIPSTTTSTSTTTGALRVGGGVGIAGALNVGGNTVFTGTIEIDGGSPGAGKVLVSDANGLASWSANANGGVSSISATATMAATDNYNVIVFSGSTASQTITLPSAVTVGAGREITIKNIASVSVRVNATSGNLISDSTTTGATELNIGIEPSNNWIRAISNGTNWIILRGLF